MIYDQPLYNSWFTPEDPLELCSDSIYIYNDDADDRSKIEHIIYRDQSNITPIKIYSEGGDGTVYIRVGNSKEQEPINLYNKSDIQNKFSFIGQQRVFMDITGLDHVTWAPLLKVFLEDGRDLKIIYAEPTAYQKNHSPGDGDPYDLREHIKGIKPLPLFASLNDSDDEHNCFVPILGFEGTRFSYMANKVEPDDSTIYPIIGCPGFFAHYIFESMLANSRPILQYGAQYKIYFAKSNCPASVYYRLQDIARRTQNRLIKIGLIGTKPHAVGALIFNMANAKSEIVYDHTIRRQGRTKGIAGRLVIDVFQFWNDVIL